MQSFDVIIVGAGISGIGAAAHLRDRCPTKTFAILESRNAIGGTWDLFRYPGIRSDSDMHTLGFGFKPWREAKSIADGPSIKKYVNETADERGITPHIRFGHRVQNANWDSVQSRWIISAEKGGEKVELSCNFLMMCAGYYNYNRAHRPELNGIDVFSGTVVHPQFWPEDLDYAGKKVVVIGSGATAMTLVPALAETADKVTMVQRSPTYVASRPDQDAIANALRKVLPEKWAYAITRFKNVALQGYIYNQSRKHPEKLKARLLKFVKDALPNYDVETHFTPSYDPWDQRLCLIPNGDLYKAIRRGTAVVETGQIDSITPAGVRMASGEEIDADILVTATGLELQLLGGSQFSIDGEPVPLQDSYGYKGMMYSNVPNLIQTFGYINASWTLRADLTSEYACRVLNRMDELGVDVVTPRLREEDRDMETRPWIENFSAGYMQRVMHLFPKQGNRDPWRNSQNYALDKKIIRKAALEDGALVFGQSASVIKWPDDVKVSSAKRSAA
jgi:monooxygenase